MWHLMAKKDVVLVRLPSPSWQEAVVPALARMLAMAGKEEVERWGKIVGAGGTPDPGRVAELAVFFVKPWIDATCGDYCVAIAVKLDKGRVKAYLMALDENSNDYVKLIEFEKLINLYDRT